MLSSAIPLYLFICFVHSYDIYDPSGTGVYPSAEKETHLYIVFLRKSLYPPVCMVRYLKRIDHKDIGFYKSVLMRYIIRAVRGYGGESPAYFICPSLTSSQYKDLGCPSYLGHRIHICFRGYGAILLVIKALRATRFYKLLHFTVFLPQSLVLSLQLRDLVHGGFQFSFVFIRPVCSRSYGLFMFSDFRCRFPQGYL